MQTTLRIDDATYREAKVEAARCGMTLTRFLEEALRQKIAVNHGEKVHGESAQPPELREEIEERDRMMEALLKRMAHFRIGAHPTREEVNAR
jgi:hypothetical protein